jgi:sporulation protein YlmC with PRC-barrel domain
MRVHPSQEGALIGAVAIDPSHDQARRRRRSGITLTLILLTAMLGLLLVLTTPRPLYSQGVKLIQVDVALVAQGYRVSKLTGTNVVNEKNEKIGSIDDLVVARDRSLFAVLQVGGFLGLGGRLVAVPYESLKIDDEGRKIELPGASRDELRKLGEFKYSS